MALIELTADDLCAMVSYPFPCEEGKIIEPIPVAHWLGFVEPTVSTVFETPADEPKPDRGAADARLVMLSLACSMEASQAVTQGGVDVQRSLEAFVNGAIASPPELTTVFPEAGTVFVVGTIVIKVPTPAPVPPHWEKGELIGRTDLLAMATRFLAASKMPSADASADYLAEAGARLIEAALTR